MTLVRPIAYRAAIAAVVALTTLALAPAPPTLAKLPSSALPLGDPDLAETRTSQTLTTGVRLIRIVRGDEPATSEEMQSTTRGPWRVNVLKINPDKARGHLRSTYGPDLEHVERTTDLVRSSGALAGVNASFFSLGSAYPGDPVGLSVSVGRLLSEPAAVASNEVDVVVDARTNKLTFGHLAYSGSVRSRRTGAVLRLEFVNHAPVVPAKCADLSDQTQCTRVGDVSYFTPEFGRSTPSGRGVEVVLGRGGCVVRTSTSRGTILRARQTSLQATGRDTASLLRVTRRSCLQRRLSLQTESGRTLGLGPTMFGVNGRYRLARNGRKVVPTGDGFFFARNPRTVVGATSDGTIMLVTIDGRQSASVGTTMEETAAVVDFLGMYNAVNLDGGGSTAMSVKGTLVNQPSDASERAVGDALVYVDTPIR